VTTLFEKPELGIYRVQVSPHSEIPIHLHREMDEEELMLGSGLFLQGRPLQRGTAVRWPKEFPHRYENPHDRERSLLRVNRPRFLPEDQVAVQAELLKMPEIRSYYPVGDAD
jgi:dihydroneopterin aldolase